MVKYFLAAAALKIFSMNETTKSAYRKMGNVLGQSKRKKQDIGNYIKRGNLLVSLCQKYGLLEEGRRFLEIGTGWIHWYGLYLHLHSDISVDLFDVWDNRQMDALKHAFGKLESYLNTNHHVTTLQKHQLSRVLQANSFEELYQGLNMAYAIDAEGSLSSYLDHTYDCVFSFHVLEHVRRDAIANTMEHIYRMLKNGGFSIHQIGIDDHLRHYDKKESPKNYLRYSDETWSRFFENAVQYHNRFQASDFIHVMEKQGFEPIETIRERCDLGNLSIHPLWEVYSLEDLETTVLTIVCQKSL